MKLWFKNNSLEFDVIFILVYTVYIRFCEGPWDQKFYWQNSIFDKIQYFKHYKLCRAKHFSLDKIQVDKIQVDKIQVDKIQVEKIQVDKIQVDKIQVDKIEYIL